MPEAVLVLGPHRSGTSLVTRLLSLLGYSLGRDLLGAHACNVAGLWENSAIVALNEKMLSRFGSAWYDHGILDTSVSAVSRNECLESVRQVVLEQFDCQKDIVIKDPRLCRLVPIYHEALLSLGFDVSAVLQLRHPHRVATSLYRRDGLPHALGVSLWISHLQQAVSDTCSWNTLLVGYEDLLAAPDEQVRRITQWCSHSRDRRDSASLRHIAGQVNPSLEAPPSTDADQLIPAGLSSAALSIYQQIRSEGTRRVFDSEGDAMPRRAARAAWLASPMLAVVHAPADAFAVELIDRIEAIAARGVATLVIKDGEETPSDRLWAGLALQGDVGLFFNRQHRGEAQSLVRGCSLATTADLLLIKCHGFPDVRVVMDCLERRHDQRPDRLLLFCRKGSGSSTIADDACVAILVPHAMVSCIDPWESIRRSGDALVNMLESMSSALGRSREATYTIINV